VVSQHDLEVETWMSKSKTNALDTLRALIAERQQYDQWIATLESNRDGTAEHVFNRVHSDYLTRLDRVLSEIRGHSEELQLSIAALSSRLAEVAKDEEAKRDLIQEAELRAKVGEYDASQWESMRAESGRELEKIAADRGSLESQLAELESIRKLSEMTSGSETGASPIAATPAATPAPTPAASVPPVAVPTPVESAPSPSAPTQTPPPREPESKNESDSAEERPKFSDVGWPARDIVDIPATPASGTSAASGTTSTPSQSRRATPSSSQPAMQAKPAEPAPRASIDPAAAAPRPSASPGAPPPAPTPPPKRRTPSGKDGQISSGFSKPVPTPPEGRPEVNKTLKCPECGTPNYPTEWYCERCGGELATM
jgi:hypothetical protein